MSSNRSMPKPPASNVREVEEVAPEPKSHTAEMFAPDSDSLKVIKDEVSVGTVKVVAVENAFRKGVRVVPGYKFTVANLESVPSWAKCEVPALEEQRQALLKKKKDSSAGR